MDLSDTSGTATLTRADLDTDLHAIVDHLRRRTPVAWVPALHGWLITRRSLAVEVLEDANGFTVDDPRFAVRQVMGANMLGLDGDEHARHRLPFEPRFKMSTVRRDLVESVEQTAATMVEELAAGTRMEVRGDLAAPLAVAVMREVLGLDVATNELLQWYDDIVLAMTAASDGLVADDARPAVMDHIGEAVRTSADGRSALLAAVAADLAVDDVVANVAVVLFGGIETAETMTATAIAHLLSRDDAPQIVATPHLLTKAIDESLRLEPAVAQLDRFATEDAEVGGEAIRRGDFVMISVASANRDPEFYTDPETFDPSRPNARNHLGFAKGPHTCLGMHLARVETRAAIEATFSTLPGLRLINQPVWSGSVFRKPDAVQLAWD